MYGRGGIYIDFGTGLAYNILDCKTRVDDFEII